MISVPARRMYVLLLNGQAKEIRPLNIIATEEFRQLLLALNEEVTSEEYANKTFSMGYVSMPKFRLLINSIFKLVDLKAEELDLDSCFKLLFPHPQEDGSYLRQGLLSRFILGEVKDGHSDYVSKVAVDTYAQMLGKLWAAIGDFDQMRQLIESVDSDTLNAMLEARGEALTPPEEKEKRNNQAKAKEAFAKMKAKAVTAEVEIEGDLKF